jgi:hypothetical protein
MGSDDGAFCLVSLGVYALLHLYFQPFQPQHAEASQELLRLSLEGHCVSGSIWRAWTSCSSHKLCWLLLILFAPTFLCPAAAYDSMT